MKKINVIDTADSTVPLKGFETRTAAVFQNRSPSAVVEAGFSIFDKLSVEFNALHSDRIDSLKLCVKRDLENLLNTRLRTPIEGFPELETSVLNYGLPCLRYFQLETPEERQVLAQCIRRSIETFEPRLASVFVQVAAEDARSDRVLYLKIQAYLPLDSRWVPVCFESSVMGSDRQLSLRERPLGVDIDG